MLVSLIKKDRIYSVTLPLSVTGSYWVSDLDKMEMKENLSE